MTRTKLVFQCHCQKWTLQNSTSYLHKLDWRLRIEKLTMSAKVVEGSTKDSGAEKGRVYEEDFFSDTDDEESFDDFGQEPVDDFSWQDSQWTERNENDDQRSTPRLTAVSVQSLIWEIPRRTWYLGIQNLQQPVFFTTNCQILFFIWWLWRTRSWFLLWTLWGRI